MLLVIQPLKKMCGYWVDNKILSDEVGCVDHGRRKSGSDAAAAGRLLWSLIIIITTTPITTRIIHTTTISTSLVISTTTTTTLSIITAAAITTTGAWWYNVQTLDMALAGMVERDWGRSGHEAVAEAVIGMITYISWWQQLFTCDVPIKVSPISALPCMS